LRLASVAHQQQRDKGPYSDPAPYIHHPVFVGMKLLQMRCGDEVVIAGILHDTLEDTKLNERQLSARFGARVANLVREVSDEKDFGMTVEEKKRSWLDRKKKFLKNLKKATKEAQLISAVDLLHNLYRLNSAIREFGRVDTLKYFNAPIEKKIWYAVEKMRIFEENLADYEEELLKPLRQEFEILNSNI
ncbi:MAG: HD domain-containing protein, partial [Deltaproteobacteria bacterium]|nr:HD domain-containing protein [Deltaproteobacteria bacterium]